ncbi:MAG: MerR family transcriptional regulator [Chitinispirillaceae bacterium]
MDYLTSGQVARKLRISVSTLKRWLEDLNSSVSDVRNAHGWRLFDQEAVKELRRYKKELKKKGRRFSGAVLEPVSSSEFQKEVGPES